MIILWGYIPFLLFLLIVGIREEVSVLIWSAFIPVWNIAISLRFAELYLKDYAMKRRRS